MQGNLDSGFRRYDVPRGVHHPLDLGGAASLVVRMASSSSCRLALRVWTSEELEGERHGIAGSAEAQGEVRAVHGLGEDGEATWQKNLGLLAGEVGGLLAEVVELVAEVGNLKPTAKGGLTHA